MSLSIPGNFKEIGEMESKTDPRSIYYVSINDKIPTKEETLRRTGLLMDRLGVRSHGSFLKGFTQSWL